MLKTNHLFFCKSLYTNAAKHYSVQKKKIQDLKPEEVTKETLQWRTPWADQSGVWYSKFKLFGSDKNNAEIIKFLQTPIKLSPSAIKKWWKRKQLETEIAMQGYIPERNKILGNDLAAAHFIVFRCGKVKFVGEDKWIEQDENAKYDLPNNYVPDKLLEAIDCSNMKLHYEGLDNLRGLKKVTWLSFNNCPYIDDWCMDRITGIFRDTVTYLDIRKCNSITDRGLSSLYKVKNLKTLYVSNITKSKSTELTCIMLQDLIPKLEIKE